jgi:phosphoenolpyruvate synthase/pyruvate phosphate dikinase
MAPTVLDSLGTKAAGLMRLAEFVDVPPFVVFPAAWLASEGALAAAILRRLDEAALREPFAVRSSSTEEDGTTDAFAGIFTTILGVSRTEVSGAVETVWESGNGERVRAYRAARGLDGAGGGVSVIVQEIVHATAAGVAFSRDPVDADCMRIEAVKGLGEPLVSGEASPDSLSIRRDDLTIVARDRGRQFLEIRPDGSREMLHPREVSAQKINEQDAKRIAAKLLTLESHFLEAPFGLDVEWALAQGELRFLQCRPITTASRPITTTAVTAAHAREVRSERA